MCIDCIAKLSRAFSFRKQCWEADMLLRSEEQEYLVQKSDVPVKSEIEIDEENDNDNKDDLNEFIELDSLNYQDDSVNYELDPSSKFEIEEYYVQDINDEMKTEFLEDEEYEAEFAYEVEEEREEDEAITEKMKRKAKVVNGEFLCQECGHISDNMQKYRNHYSYHHDKKSQQKRRENSVGEWDCEICDKKFTKLQLYKRHMRLHDPNNPNRCEICNLTFVAPSILESHMYTHTGKFTINNNI